jgi:hypothetical protein
MSFPADSTLLVARGVTKRFGAVEALVDVVAAITGAVPRSAVAA